MCRTARASSSPARAALLEHFKVQSLDTFGVSGMKLGIRAAGALMRYLEETQKNALEHLTELNEYHDKRYMMLDHTARRNLELTETMRSRQKQGSLLGILDYTCTAMAASSSSRWPSRAKLTSVWRRFRRCATRI